MNKFHQYRVFVQVVNEGSLSGAARVLNVTPSAISKQLSGLEDSLGIQLVTRTQQAVNPTQAGRTFYHRARDILTSINHAEQDLSHEDDALNGDIAVTISKSMIRSPVMNWISGFSATHPDIRFQLKASEQLVDLYEQDVDFAFRLGHTGDSTRLVQQRLLNTSLRCVASPAYLDRYGYPEGLEDLSHHALWLPENQNLSEQLRKWVARHKQHINWQRVHTANDIEVAFQMVRAGYGISFFIDLSVSEELDSGSLIDLLPNAKLPTKPLYLLRKRGEKLPRRIQQFRDVMAEQARYWKDQ